MDQENHDKNNTMDLGDDDEDANIDSNIDCAYSDDGENNDDEDSIKSALLTWLS